jgi:DNA-binding beta-propeller fold protein YncE
VGILSAGLLALVLASRGERLTVLQTVTDRDHPTFVAVDSGTGRAFVLNQGSLAVSNQTTTQGYTAPGTISMLDTRTGAVLRTVAAGNDPHAAAFDGRTGRVYVVNSMLHSSGLSTLEILDAHSGRVLRTVNIAIFSGAVAVDERAGQVYTFGQGPPSINALDTTGRQVATITLNNPSNAQPNAYALALDARRSHLFAAPGMGAARGVSIPRPSPHIRLRRLTLAGDNVVVSAATGRAFAFDPTGVQVFATDSGRLLQHIDLGPTFSFAGAVTDDQTGRIFVSALSVNADGVETGTGQVYVLDGHDGTILARVGVRRPGGLAVDARTGDVLVADAGPHDVLGTYSGPGSVALMDGRSGAVRAQIGVGVAPVAVAVDARTRHAFVVNYGGMMAAPDAWGWLPRWLRRSVPALAPLSASARFVPGSVSMLALPD